MGFDNICFENPLLARLARLVRLARLPRLARLVSPHSITQNVLDMVGYGWIWLELH